MTRLCEPSIDHDGLVSLPVSALFPSAVARLPVHIQDHGGGPMLLYRGADYPITATDIKSLDDRGITEVYVDSNTYHKCQSYLKNNLPTLLENEELAVNSRFQVLNEVVRHSLNEVLSGGNVEKNVKSAKYLGSHIVDLLSHDGIDAKEVHRLMCHDYGTFTHTANVAYYCVILAMSLGITDKDELRSMATGGLLHDYGKIAVPASILNKPGKLDDREWKIVKQHPTEGFRRLCRREELPFSGLMMVYQHHERLDGAGYPVGLVGDEIHLWARVCAVVDVFESLTGNRPYRTAAPISKAFSILDRQSGTGLDAEIVRCWKSTIATK